MFEASNIIFDAIEIVCYNTGDRKGNIFYESLL